MKKLLLTVLVLFSLTICARSQNSNPQPSFSSAVLSAKPLLYLNFNDFATSFLDQISGLDFGSTFTGPSTVGSLPTVTTTGGNPRVYMMSTDFSGSGTVSTLSVQFNTAPTAGAQYPILVATDNGSGSYTITAEPGSITVAATTAVQTFTSGSGLPVFTVTQGQTIGFVVPTGFTGIGYTTGVINYWSLNTATVPTIGTPTAYGGGAFQIALSATVNNTTQTSSGATTPRQPGFDSTQINNTSAEFTYNAWNSAANATLGAIDWSSPYTLMVHIDRLNWNRTGTLIVASKGDSSSSQNSWWKIYFQMAGLYSQVCFERNGYSSAAAQNAQNGVCTSANFDAVPNGFNYNIIVTDAGTGASPNCAGCTFPLNLYINGLNGTYIPETQFSNTFTTGFGFVTPTIASGGTGYASSTAFTSSGGGPNCTVTGTVAATGGVLTSIGSITNNWGCTSNPTINLTAPSGTGGSITAVARATSMNSTAFPLLVPGYVSSGLFNGVAQATSSQAPTYVDEFALFPSVLNSTQIQSIVYQTKFYQGLLSAVPTPKPVVIWDGTGGGDPDGWWGLAEVIKLHQLGVINLEGVVVEDESVTCEAMQRQMLDSAGLNNVPISVPTTFFVNSGTEGCTTPMVTTYNASTPLSNAAWESAATMERKIFASNPSMPVFILMDSAYTGTAEFMASPADSISTLTGLQLMAQNATNGGAIYTQGGGGCNGTHTELPPCTGSTTSDNALVDPVSGQYVYANNGATPIYLITGTPASTGPGPTFTRTSTDPLYLFLVPQALTRQGWGSLVAADVVSNYFKSGVQVIIGGSGAGYAASTPFTSTGGGANCNVTGIMTASSGVPNGIEYSWGATYTSGIVGLGNGCTSAPTINLTGATGAGVTLTAIPNTFCTTVSIAEPGGVWTMSTTSATCSNHYLVSPSAIANPSAITSSGAAFQQFVNSLVNPIPSGAPRGIK